MASSGRCGLRFPFGKLYEVRERISIVEREIRQDTPIELHSGRSQPAHEARVGRAVLSNGRVDSHNPESAKISLANTPIPISVLETFLNRVLGGGLVPGAAVLVGGDPGIGKSTLLLQTAAELAQDGHRIVYLSGEEAPAQVRMRASRLGVAEAPVALGTETNIASIIATLGSGPAPALVVIDSVQTLWSEGIESAPGTISQLRGCASALIIAALTGKDEATCGCGGEGEDTCCGG